MEYNKNFIQGIEINNKGTEIYEYEIIEYNEISKAKFDNNTKSAENTFNVRFPKLSNNYLTFTGISANLISNTITLFENFMK